MLGNSSGGSAGAGGLGRTSVGIRGYTGITGAVAKKSAKAKKSAEQGKLDRVVREEANQLLSAINPDERGEHSAEELVLPAGHSAARRHFEGRAFRVDEKGRTLPPVYGDVDQGNLGDSWLLASCAAVAHAQPAKLLKRVTSNGDGTFNVKLGRDDFRITPEFSGE